jgi:dipeptidyl aminopeptidase/acylaminoacyl peptidase
MPHAVNARALRRGVYGTLLFGAFAVPVGAQQSPVLSAESWQRPPQAIAEAVGAPRERNVSLSNLSPDRKNYLWQQSDGMPTMQEFAKPHVYLGGVQVDIKANRSRALSTRGAAGIFIISAETGAQRAIQIPKGAAPSNAQWSPDGRQVAFFANFDSATHIYVADAATGRSKPVTKTAVLATVDASYDWTSDGKGIVTVLVPDNRGPVPAEPAVPTTPKVRVTTPEKNAQRTYASLLETPHDMALLEYYATGQVAVIDVNTRVAHKVGKPAMVTSIDPGPRGEYLRVTTMTKPFSYIVPASSFGSREELWGPDGKVIARLSERALNIGTPPDSASRAGRENDRRNIAWRPDGMGLSYLQMEPAPARRGDTTSVSSDSTGAAPATSTRTPRRKDRLMLWKPPFDSAAAEVVYASDNRLGSVDYSSDGKIIFVSETGAAGGTGAAPAGGRAGGAASTTVAIYLAEPLKKYTVVRRPSGDDAFYKDPGSLIMKPGPVSGQVVMLSTDASHVFLRGTQYFEKPN